MLCKQGMMKAWLSWTALWLALALAGCIDVDGGAVEASWDLRFPDGRRTDDDGNTVNCKTSGMDRMAFALLAVDGAEDPCAGQETCQFPCSSQGVGTTDFIIPPGQYAIEVQVLDTAGKALGPADGIVAPGPVVRDVTLGEITSLSVNLIIVDR